jgi:hypothetical protein
MAMSHIDIPVTHQPDAGFIAFCPGLPTAGVVAHSIPALRYNVMRRLPVTMTFNFVLTRGAKAVYARQQALRARGRKPAPVSLAGSGV